MVCLIVLSVCLICLLVVWVLVYVFDGMIVGVGFIEIVEGVIVLVLFLCCDVNDFIDDEVSNDGLVGIYYFMNNCVFNDLFIFIV